MMNIQLQNLRFYGKHGIHDEEAVTGNVFEINVCVSFKEKKFISSLSDTINYVSVYEKVKENMERPEKLLETLAMKITNDIFSIDDNITSVKINIKKPNAPIINFNGAVAVEFYKEKQG